MLPPGRMLGRYEVMAPLGAGGMGEVYRARDAELQRDVAVKILPEELSSDPERVKRFEREAKAAAALSHPNVLTVFDVGRQDGRAYLVFELLEGSTLAEVMKPGGLRTREVLEYAAQIARGLAAVHTGGLVHRDLKPANLFLTSAGIVKIIDFGLARVSATSPQPREETTADVTGPGVAPGTVSYMAPEQSQGLVLDARSDIFSLGTVLYEMLSGRHPFRRASAAETVAAILRDDPPDLGRLDGVAVGALKQVVGRCLEKRPEDRFQTANDLALAFEALKQGRESTPDEGRSRPREPEDSQRKLDAAVRAGGRRRWIALALAVSLIAAAIAWGVLRGRELPLPPARLVPLTTTTGSESNPSFSPDGEQVAFESRGERSDNTDIYIKLIGSSEVRQLTTDPAPDWDPTWSPDGRQIAFVRASNKGGVTTVTIHVVSPLGGPDRKLTDERPGQGMSWSPDGRWLATGATFAAQHDPAAAERGIRLINVSGGEVRAATAPRAPSFDKFPAFSPDGRHLAYASCLSPSTCHLDVIDLTADAMATGSSRRLTTKPIWLRWGSAWTSDARSVVYPAGVIGRLWRVPAGGGQEPQQIELAGFRVASVAIPAKGNRLAFERWYGHQAVARFVPGGRSETLVTSSFTDRFPDYSPDGKRFAFESSREGDASQIWLAEADGSNPTQLTRGPGLFQGSPRFSPDGRTIAFDSLGEDGRWDIWTIDTGGGPPHRFTTHPGDDNLPSWSRDGRYLYWSSDRAGVRSIWRAPAGGGAEERVTREAGSYSHEAVDGRTLFFMPATLGGAPLLAADIGGTTERTVVECVSYRGFAAHAAGLYHVGCGLPQARQAPLYLRDPATGRDRLLGTLDRYELGLAVAPDGKSILYGSIQGEGSDLMLIENFR